MTAVKKILAGLLSLSFIGCAKLARIDELLTLKDLSEDQDRQAAQIQQQEKNFERVVMSAKSGSFAQFGDREHFSEAFGPPLLVNDIRLNEEVLERWLYCHPTKVLHSERVYVYFNQSGRLVDWKYIPSTQPVGANKGDSHG